MDKSRAPFLCRGFLAFDLVPASNVAIKASDRHLSRAAGFMKKRYVFFFLITRGGLAHGPIDAARCPRARQEQFHRRR